MEENIEILNILLKKNYDALKEYKNAAAAVNSANLHEFFNQKANERYFYANQIKEEIKRLSGSLFEEKHYKKYHIDKWTDFKFPKVAKNKSALLKACEKGEKNCAKDYDEKLKKGSLPDHTRRLIQMQRDEIVSRTWDTQLNLLKYRISDFTRKLISRSHAFHI